MWRFARGGTAGIWVGAMVAFPQVPDLPAILPPAEIVAPPTTAPAAAPVAPRPVAAPPSQNAELVAPRIPGSGPIRRLPAPATRAPQPIQAPAIDPRTPIDPAPALLPPAIEDGTATLEPSSVIPGPGPISADRSTPMLVPPELPDRPSSSRGSTGSIPLEIDANGNVRAGSPERIRPTPRAPANPIAGFFDRMLGREPGPRVGIGDPPVGSEPPIGPAPRIDLESPAPILEGDRPDDVDPSIELRAEIEDRVRAAAGSKLRDVEVLVSGKRIHVRGQAARFWQKRAARQAIEDAARVPGYRTTIDVR